MKLVPRLPDKAYIDTWLWCPKRGINVDGLKTALTSATLTGREKEENPEGLKLYRETEHHLLVPREFWSAARVSEITGCEVIDCRPRFYEQTNVQSLVVLDGQRPEQTVQYDSMVKLLEARGGILQLSCGKGKTVVAIDFACRRKMPTIIAVPDTQLMKQWLAEILRFTNLREEDVGRIQGNVFDWQKPFVLATYDTLWRRAYTMPEEVRRYFGTCIFDEGHRVGAEMYARTATLWYGYRLILSATPERSDGRAVVYENHIGRVIHKDLSQDLIPEVKFAFWPSGFDWKDPAVQAQVTDTSGEVHYGLLAGFLARSQSRLDFIIDLVRREIDDGHETLILSRSVDELVNLLAVWSNQRVLYTDVPIPTTTELGLPQVAPAIIDEGWEYDQIVLELAKHREELQLCSSEFRKGQLEARISEIELRLQMDEVGRAVQRELDKRQKTYREWLLAKPSTGGLMIHAIKPEVRERLLNEKEAMFVSMKYGKEGLNKKSLSTVIVCHPVKEEGPVAQIMGRVQRLDPNNPGKQPRVIFVETDAPLIRGMCENTRRQLRNWPADQGGPLDYIMEGYPFAEERSWIRS